MVPENWPAVEAAARELLAKLEGLPDRDAFALMGQLTREEAYRRQQAIDAGGNVLDRASDTLGPLRRQLLKMRSRLQETAEGILSSPRYARHVQETYATIRSGRVVIPFKASAKGLFQGIVHDSSQSGQTVFFEPEELVHLNNEVKMAELEVEREVARILAELSGRVARKEEELLLALSLLARIDAIQARSLLADELTAAEPTVTDAGETSLRAALHPLLVLSGRPVVPNDLRLGRPYLCLILTGPNAGGKTVALKTLGLLTLMAMAGLSIPASPDSTVSVFHNLFVAVGDEQSVEGDLSTYSAHIRRLNEILTGADRGSLVLLDEVVSGTDPREGAAIARAFLETLADREVRVVATTHFEELKGIAFTDPRFENGSMAFDGVHLRPTYRLSLGVPGRSMGIEIARSLGFPDEVLERAKGYLSGPGPNLTEVIDRLERELHTGSQLTERMWSRREIENYLITPASLRAFILKDLRADDLIEAAERAHRLETFETCLEEILHALTITGKPDPWGPNIKATDDFLDPLFKLYYERLGVPQQVFKRDYHGLIRSY